MTDKWKNASNWEDKKMLEGIAFFTLKCIVHVLFLKDAANGACALQLLHSKNVQHVLLIFNHLIYIHWEFL